MSWFSSTLLLHACGIWPSSDTIYNFGAGFFHRGSTCLVHKITIVVLIQISAKKHMKRCVFNKWLFQHQILRINIEKNPAKFRHPSRGPSSPRSITPISRNRTFLKIDSLEGPIDPWQEVRQATVEADALEVPRNTGRVETGSFCHRNFPRKQFPWGWTEPTAIPLVGSNNVATLKKTSKNKKHFTFSNLLPAQKVTSNLLPKIKKYRKIPWQVFPLCRKSVGIPTNAGSRQSSRI